MQFDVIISNPPYQQMDGGYGKSAKPIYNLFIDQAKKLNPRYLTMIIPSRWFAGGKGLDEFRTEMLNDDRISHLIDYIDSQDCFPEVNISGGVCYFLWARNNHSDCNITTIKDGIKHYSKRPLLEKNNDIFIRYAQAIPILQRIQSTTKSYFNEIVSRNQFGIKTNAPTDDKMTSNSLFFYAYPKNGFINKNKITKNVHLIDKYKIFTAKAGGGERVFPSQITGKPFIGGPGTCGSGTYLLIGPFDTEQEALNVLSYTCTRFFRFMVLLRKNTQDVAKGVYSFVPIQIFNESWTDEKLYKKYELTQDEIEFIETMVKPINRSIGKSIGNKMSVILRKIINLPLDRLHSSYWNPNEQSDEVFNKLVAEIGEEGFDEPIQVAPCSCDDIDGDHYVIIGGEHRFKAMIFHDAKEIPSVIYEDWDEQKQKLKTVQKNLLRGEMNDTKFTKLVQSLVDDGIDQARIAEEMGFTNEKEFYKHYIEEKDHKEKSFIDALMDESNKELEAVDSISDILNGILSDYGDTVQQNFMFFSYKGKTHLMVTMDTGMYKEVEEMVEHLIETGDNAADYLKEVLKDARDRRTGNKST